jgi:hypothetical protein
MMQSRPFLTVTLTIVGSLLFVGIGLAQVSPNFDLSWFVFSGGGDRQSTNYVIQDSLGEWVGDVSTSANTQIASGFVTHDLVSAPSGGDSFEVDNNCGQATVINPDGSKQAHTFHAVGDQDWLKFSAQDHKTYVIEINNLGAKADATVVLHDSCDKPPAAQGNNSFGSTVRLQWNSTKNGDYYLELQQFDPTFFGQEANYQVSVTIDNAPPSAPQSPRCIAINDTTLGLQWKKSPEPDVKGYRISYTGSVNGSEDVAGATTSYYELGNLTANQTYQLRVLAVDYSNNESPPSGQVQCEAKAGPDHTQPSFSLAQPANGAFYTTTANLLTFTGNAQDPGNNLSRVNVHNTTANVQGWDYSLTGSSHDFRVKDLSLGVGDNNVQVTVYDDAGNTSQKAVTVRRLGQVGGGVIIIAGHNDTFGLQTNIYNAANRAYRIFKSAGFSDNDIYYIAPVAQDVSGTGGNDVDATSSPAAIQNAITTWAKEGGRVGPGKPLFIYMVDHGFLEKFCASGCGAGGQVTPADLDGWLRTLETETGADQVNVLIEACQSGSFIDRFNGDVANSLSKVGRVIISATGRDNNAYASAEGAYFSDAFFSCLADSNSLKVCYEQGKAAVLTTGVNQTPWLDDNGDGISNEGDGSVAQGRVLTHFFSSIRPQINSVKVDKQGANGVLTANVVEGAEELAIVWAAVYPPSFKEPTDVTINLNVPTVRLEPDPNNKQLYSFAYTNGFLEQGDYRVVFYAQDRLGIHALPRREGELSLLYLPIVRR